MSFGLPPGMAIEPDLERLGEEIQNGLRNIADSGMRHVLALMNNKIDLLGRRHCNQALPDEQTIVLSSEGLELTIDRACDTGTWLGVHLLLDDGFNFVSAGQVSHCTSRGNDFQLGVALTQMEEHNARRLTRFVMRQQKTRA